MQTEKQQSQGQSKLWFTLLILAIVLSFGGIAYLIQDQTSFFSKEGKEALNRTQQQDTKKILSSMKEEQELQLNTIQQPEWESFSVEDALSFSYPSSWHIAVSPSDLPASWVVGVGSKPIEFGENAELLSDPEIKLELRALIDDYVRDQALLDELAEELLFDLNEISYETITTEQGLRFDHYTGVAKIAAELDQPQNMYFLLFEDTTETLYQLTISSISTEAELQNPSLKELVESITLFPGNSFVDLVSSE